jgi:1,4-dihydroxy-2-naphthoate octaprenyltransferase
MALMLIGQYVLVAYLVAISFFTPLVLLVFLALPKALPALRVLRAPRPETRPADYPERVWPGWFVAYAFLHNRRWGSLFLLGLVGEVVARQLLV